MPRKRPEDRWPQEWQHETPLERREHVARDYRAALFEIDPIRCGMLDDFFRRRGQAWVVPQLAIYKAEDLLTAELVADLEKVTPRTVDNWVGLKDNPLKVTKTPDGNRFLYEDVLAFRANQRRRRVEARKARRAEKVAIASGGVVHVP